MGFPKGIPLWCHLGFNTPGDRGVRERSDRQGVKPLENERVLRVSLLK